ncbi:Prolamin-like domain containing protein [Trema orientale]|uniref:Prolamin-like domain containing protein n=1 Tax=Trema orientale TaxID=63057 RepID=A0A2P5FRD8_TREOI|nr:Prolamin-like domain containing protein [Trema orientale]
MATTLKLFIFMTIVSLATPTSMARSGVSVPAGQSNIMARLKLEDESSNCWDSLIQLQACTGEIILFFLNGETYLGPSCCQAIRIIGQHCWPAMFGTIGFTTEEADVLEGYCDKETAHSPPPPPPPSSPSVHDQVVFSGNLTQ